MAARNLLKALSALCLGFIGLAASAQAPPYDWTWMGGSSSIPANGSGQPGTYGVLGTAAAGNIPGGRESAASWTGSSGHFWLFGGYGFDGASAQGLLNDLWEFDPSTKEWAWMGGGNAIPSCSGLNSCGQSGVYGTLGTAASGNIPGARELAEVWTDPGGNLWLFGGEGYDSVGTYGYLNDLWEFNPSKNQWAWMGGSATAPVPPNGFSVYGNSGVYGALGEPSSGNIPGSRENASTWTDANGHLWLFGGNGDDSLGNEGWLDDLWEFNPASGQWTWIAGSSEIFLSKNPGTYGTLGVPAAGNFPGARQGATTWIDSSGNLWLFGGDGWDANGDPTSLNDLWEFSPSENEWTWMGGPSTEDEEFFANPGVYGTLGTFAPENIPSGRTDAVGWTGSNGKFWLFGGSGVEGASFQDTGYLNDAWEYDPSTNQWAWMGETIAACGTCNEPGTYGTLGTPNPANTPGARIWAARWTGTSGHFWLFGGGGFDGTGNYGYLNDLWQYQPPTATPPATVTPAVTVSPSPSSITTAQALTVMVSLSGGSGNPTPTGSVTLTSGLYTSATAALTGGSATINVSAGVLLAAVDTLTAYYTPDAASSSTYNSASGSNTVDVANASAIANTTVLVTPVAYSIWTTVALPVTVAVYGGVHQTATGTVTLSAGSYTSAPIALGGGIGGEGVAHFVVPAGSMPAGTNTVTASYTPDAGSSETFSSAMGTASVVVGVQPVNGYDWTWVGGNSIIPGDNDEYGIYGTLGTAAAGNFPGGHFGSSYWTDSSGKFWLFGGEGNDADNHGILSNELWKFDPATNEWAWIGGDSTGVYSAPAYIDPAVYGTQGVFAATNTPGGRYQASSWIDSAGHLWLFGGYGFDAKNVGAYLNDLWEFDPSTNEWAWISGSSTAVGAQYGQGGVYGTQGTPAPGNVPAARLGAASWIDNNGNLWLFGGFGQDSTGGGCDESSLNDLWEFSPSTGEWTWIGGSALTTGCEFGPAPPAGVYGTLGTPAAGNIPAARNHATTWVDSKGHFWLFGGLVTEDEYAEGTFNDLWEFDPTTMLWTWMGGGQTVGQAGVYGTLGTPAAGNQPGSRAYAQGWIDNSGNFWLLGGGAGGFLEGPQIGLYNDFWVFNPSTNLWAWMGGSDPSYEDPGIYGTLGTPAPGNIPGSRELAATWIDKGGHFWLFGGNGWDSTGQDGWLNDLWEYEPATGTSTPDFTITTTTPTKEVAKGGDSATYVVTITAVDGFGGQVAITPTSNYPAMGIQYPATVTIPPGGSQNFNVVLVSQLSPSGTFPVTVTAATAGGLQHSLVISLIVDNPALMPSVTVTPSPSSITTAQADTVTITVSGGSGNPTPTGSVTLSSGTYTSAATALSGGSAIITVPAGSLAKGADTLSATYTPDSSSSSTYNSAMGSNTVTVTAPALITPTVTVSPSPSSITTAQSLSVTITVSGGSGNPTPTGSVTLSSGTYTSAATALSGGSAIITVPAGSLAKGADTLSATYTPDSSSSSTYNSAMGSNTVTVTAAAVQVTVGTTPAGLSFSVDGTTYTSTQALSWTPGSSHTLATTSPQTNAGTQNTFASWSDAGALSHSVTAPSSAASYTASFNTSYQLTTAASPSSGGSVSPASGSFYSSGTVVNLAATANSGYAFTSWTGNVASASSASTTIAMSAPQSVTANFSLAVVTAPVASLTPASLSFTSAIGVTSTAQIATLSNTGNAMLAISGIGITGTNPTDFAVATGTNACGSSLDAGSTCSIYVTFTPASVASFAAMLSVADNASGSPQTTSLTGTGTAAPSFIVTSPTLPQSIQPGNSAQYTIAVTAQNGTFSSPVALTASGLPTGATASFLPASITPGSSSANSTLTIQTPATTASAAPNHAPWPLAVPAMALLGFFFLPAKRRRRWLALGLLLFASLGALTALSACGGGFGFTAVAPAQSYTVTVTGTSGAVQQTTTLQLTVE